MLDVLLLMCVCRLQMELKEMDVNLQTMMLQNVPSIELNRRLLQNEINARRVADIIAEASRPDPHSLPTNHSSRSSQHDSRPTNHSHRSNISSVASAGASQLSDASPVAAHFVSELSRTSSSDEDESFTSVSSFSHNVVNNSVEGFQFSSKTDDELIRTNPSSVEYQLQRTTSGAGNQPSWTATTTVDERRHWTAVQEGTISLNMSAVNFSAGAQPSHTMYCPAVPPGLSK